MIKKVKIISLLIYASTIKKIIPLIIDLVKSKKGNYICLANVHMCMEAFKSKDIELAVNNSAFTLADGRPIFWAQRFLGLKHAEQIRGEDLMTKLFQVAEREGFSIGFYGGESLSFLSVVEMKLKN
jgi:N-acetylglucosaminyldiphosphoundecaprenol N-acetyl-beta-D-mannosaminyltransferase